MDETTLTTTFRISIVAGLAPVALSASEAIAAGAFASGSLADVGRERVLGITIARCEKLQLLG